MEMHLQMSSTRAIENELQSEYLQNIKDDYAVRLIA